MEDDPPMLDLAREAAVQAFVREAIGRGLVASAQDVSGGGLAVALAEGAMWSGLGASVRVAVGHSPAVDLFGEGPSRLVVTCRPRYGAALTLLARQHGLPVETIGSVGGDRLLIELSAAGDGRRGRGPRRRRGRPPRGARPRPPSRLGPRARPRPRLGGADRCVACSGSCCRVPSRPMPRRSPRSACSPCSTAARNRPGWRSATASS